MICTIMLFFLCLFLMYMIYNIIQDYNKLDQKFNTMCGIIDTVADITDDSGDKVPVKDLIDEFLEEG